MNKIAIAVAVSLLAGLAVGAYLFSSSQPETIVASSVDPANYFDQTAATETRIRALEAAVAEERNARQLLENELQVLYAEIGQLSDEREAREAIEEKVQEEQRLIQAEIMQRAVRTDDGRVTRLINAGFTPERADWILQREAELQMEVMQARFDARRSGEPMDPFNPSLNPNSRLRSEIGDAQYEQYLQANNRPITISVGSVLESSPGQRAGLLPGDQIVSYDGNRVFDVSDLNQQTMLGEPGESVVVDITRDGMPMQVVMPRGPIGVTTGRFRGRR